MSDCEENSKKKRRKLDTKPDEKAVEKTDEKADEKTDEKADENVDTKVDATVAATVDGEPVAVEPSPREQIKLQLLELVAAKLAASEAWAESETGEWPGLDARQGVDEEGISFTVTKLHVSDLDLVAIPSHPLFTDYDRAYLDLSSKSPRCPQITRLPDVQGATAMRHLELTAPWPLTNRSIIAAYYYITGEDGSFTFLASSRGNEEIVEAKKDIIGENVLANMVVNYHRFEKGADAEHSVKITSVLAFDPKGTMSIMLRRKLAGKQIHQSRHIANFLRDGTISHDF